MKQKLMIIAAFSLITGASSITFAVAGQSDAALAQQRSGLDCSELTKPEDIEACETTNREVNENKNRSGNGMATTSLADCKDGDEKCCGKVKTSIIGGTTICDKDGEGGIIFGLLKWVLRIMTAGVGVAAVGGIGYGALLYTTAENKPDQTKKAIGIITNVVIGIVAYALMAVFLNFLIPGGIIG